MPEIGPEDVLLKVGAAGLCHTDLYTLRGQNPTVAYPIVPGHEFSGVVERCGPLVRHVRPGDRVAVMTILACGACRQCRQGRTTHCLNYSELGSQRNGGFSEYAAVPARSLVPVSDRLSLEEAALAEPAANAYSVVSHAGIEPGDRVVIIGPGPIGLLALQFAKLRQPGALILVGTRDERLAAGRRLGATHTIHIRRADPVETIRTLTNGLGADVVLQCAGTVSGTELAFKIVGNSGRIAIEGVTDGTQEVGIAPNQLIFQGLRIVGVRGWSVHEFATAVDLMNLGLLDLESLLTHRLSLDAYESAYTLIDARKDEVIKAQFVL